MTTEEIDYTRQTKSLEQEHAEAYLELIETIDELLIKTNQSTLNPEQITSEYNKFKLELKDLQLLMLHTKEFNPENRSEDELLNESLEQLIKLRLDIFNQHLMTHPNLKIIHGDENQVNYDKLNKLIRDKDSKNVDLLEHLDDVDVRRQLRELKIRNQKRLDNCKSEIVHYLELVEENKDLKFQNQINNSIDDDDEDNDTLHILKSKYLNVSKKNMMLSQFNLNLISSLSNVDLFNDERLREILLSCGDYDDYGLLNDEVEENE